MIFFLILSLALLFSLFLLFDTDVEGANDPASFVILFVIYLWFGVGGYVVTILGINVFVCSLLFGFLSLFLLLLHSI